MGCEEFAGKFQFWLDGTSSIAAHQPQNREITKATAIYTATFVATRRRKEKVYSI